jgi:hypothetical protein
VSQGPYPGVGVRKGEVIDRQSQRGSHVAGAHGGPYTKGAHR